MISRLHIPSIVVIAFAWALFLLSFFLPATNSLEVGGTPPGTPLTGWQAFTASLSAGASNHWVFFFDPRVFLVLIYPFANGLMLLTPMLLCVLREKSAALAIFLIPSLLPIWFLPYSLRGDLFIGFYVWQFSFVLMAIGCILSSLAFGESGDIGWSPSAQKGPLT